MKTAFAVLWPRNRNRPVFHLRPWIGQLTGILVDNTDFLPVLREQLNVITFNLEVIGLAADLQVTGLPPPGLGRVLASSPGPGSLTPGLWISGLELALVHSPGSTWHT